MPAFEALARLPHPHGRQARCASFVSGTALAIVQQVLRRLAFGRPAREAGWRAGRGSIERSCARAIVGCSGRLRRALPAAEYRADASVICIGDPQPMHGENSGDRLEQ